MKPTCSEAQMIQKTKKLLGRAMAEIKQNSNITNSELGKKLRVSPGKMRALAEELAKKDKLAMNWLENAAKRRWGWGAGRPNPPTKIPDPVGTVLNFARKGLSREQIIRKLMNRGYVRRGAEHILVAATRAPQFNRMYFPKQKKLFAQLRGRGH